MKFLAQIQTEFVRIARRWDRLTREQQVGYLHRHPASRLRVTAQPTPRSETSGLKIHDPKRSQSHQILDMFRSQAGAEGSPVWRKYLTMRSSGGENNKYHYFGVFGTKDGNFVAANVWGRIGYPPKGIKVLGESSSQSSAMKAAERKLEKKMKKGYVPTSL